MAVPMVSSAKGSLLDISSVTLLRFVQQGGTLRHFNMLQDVTKVVLWAGAILLLRFQKMRCIFRGRRSTLSMSFCVAGTAH